jgi:hypothetical protein
VESRLDDAIAVEYFEDYSIGSNPTLDQGRGWSGNGVTSGTAAIVSRTDYGGNPQKRLTLASGQYGRTFAWGAKWNRLLLGVAVRTTKGSNISANFHFGVCSGTTNMAGSGTCDNFMGWAGATSGTITFTRTVGTQLTYFTSAATIGATRRGTTTTSRGAVAASTPIADTEAFMHIWFLELQRTAFTGAGSFTASNIIRFQGATQREFQSGKSSMLAHILRQQSYASHLNVNTALGGFAFDESTGVLDSFNFWWDGSDVLDIAALGAVRLM